MAIFVEVLADTQLTESAKPPLQATDQGGAVGS
jgi:hypothetical protein